MPTKKEWLEILKVPVSGVDELRDIIRRHTELFLMIK